MDRQIELQQVTRVYGTAVPTTVLKGVDLSFRSGEVAAIIGQSGSGKTTLLNIISALDRPTSGTVYIEGQDVTTLNDSELARFRNQTLGFVFQFHHLLPEFSALENVLIPYWLAQGRPPQATVDLARELLTRVGIAKDMDRRIGNFSGGQQQRVAIARALVNRPRIILADEPTGSLDSDTTGAVMELLREINREFQTTFIVVTHDRHIASQCDRVVEILDGRIVRDSAMTALDENQRWREVGPAHCFRIQEWNQVQSN